MCSRAGAANGIRKGNGVAEAELLLGYADIGHIAVSSGAGVGLAQDVNGFVWRQDVAHQMGEGGDADHLIGAHVVGLAGPAVLQQGEEPMGQVALVEVGAQVGAVARDRDGIGREGIADEVADGEVHVERQVGTHEGKAAGHNDFQAMLLAHQRAKVFGGALGLALGRDGFGQSGAACPVFVDGGEISRLGAVDGAGTGEKAAASACGHGQIEDVAGAIHDLVVAE
jgi:hypothetical protein